jgi:hypothetical protein
VPSAKDGTAWSGETTPSSRALAATALAPTVCPSRTAALLTEAANASVSVIRPRNLPSKLTGCQVPIFRGRSSTVLPASSQPRAR